MKTAQRILDGKRGEQAVATQLHQQGFTIVAHNYRRFYGEIDIIGHKKDLLIFVEVKTRTNDHIDPAELIVPSKQHKIGLVAQEFMATHSDLYYNVTCRFDVALVSLDNNNTHIRYIENAFTLVE